MAYEEMVDKIIQGDALEIMSKMPVGVVDMILTDPPYGISKEMKITRTRNSMKFKASTDISSMFGAWDEFKSLADFFEFTFAWVEKADKILRPGGMFISYFDKDKINFLSHFLQGKGYKLKGYYADCKKNPVPQARKVKWMSGWEIAGMWQKPDGKLTYNWELGQHKDYGLRPIVSGNERTKHPTQKPESVIADFVLWWTNENDLILDPFVGSGTMAVVARKLGRRYIGIELAPEYIKIANERLSQLQLL